MNLKKQGLIDKGVVFQNIESVFIDENVDIDRIESGAVICQGARISGEETYISKGCIVGSEGVCVINNCVMDKNGDLGSGYFDGSVFLKNFKSGGNAHVRKGCLFEEQSSIAHSVGTKQTILFPYVTLGSLVNFCDCMMTGGTSSKNHSEVGSSFIHFNFTPNQDKATPSIMGNVYQGVFLNNPPVFLGGQGGMVGPCKIGFGNVSAAGSIIRSDEERNGRLIFEYVQKNININQKSDTYPALNRIVKNNIFYIANLVVLKNWYKFIRSGFLPPVILESALKIIDICIDERLKRLSQLKEKLESGLVSQPAGKLFELKKNYCLNIGSIIDIILRFSEKNDIEKQKRDKFLESIIKNNKEDYLGFIHLFENKSIDYGVDWLESIKNSMTLELSGILEEFKLF